MNERDQDPLERRGRTDSAARAALLVHDEPLVDDMLLEAPGALRKMVFVIERDNLEIPRCALTALVLVQGPIELIAASFENVARVLRETRDNLDAAGAARGAP